MLNIAKLGVGQEAYYLGTIAAGIEDYYTGAGEAPGYWWGGGLGEIDLERGSTVTPEQLRAVLGATHPATGTRLARRRIPGWDLAFRAPKSVSVLYGLADDATSRQVRIAHDTAVAEALSYLENEAVRVRRGKGGTTRLATRGLVAALFRHRTSRAGDPQLHTHALVANVAMGDDDRWGALYSPQLYQHGKTAGYLYQAALRHELSRRLGVEWGPIVNGCADAVGIPKPLLDGFSKRRQAITALMRDRGEHSARAAQVATLLTRQAKDRSIDPVTLTERWRREATTAGFDVQRLDELLHRSPPPEPTPDELAAVADHLAGPTGLTAHASTFSRRDVVRGCCEHLPAATPPDRIEELADAILDEHAGLTVALSLPPSATVPAAPAASVTDVIRREDGRVVVVDADAPRYSTPELLALEQAAIAAALTRNDERAGVVARTTVETALAHRPTIAPEQAHMVRELTTSGHGVEIVVGPAGTGKTFALDAARAAWEADGFRVIGAALAAKAAAELEAGAGIDSYTVDSLLADLDRPGGSLSARTVLVVDEAGMVGTRKLARLLGAGRDAGAKIVLVGDHHQLPEVDAGGVFRGLVHRSQHTIELQHNRRQQHAWEIAALAELRAGDPATAVDAYQQHGRVIVGDTADRVRQRLVDDWWEQVTAGREAAMVALRRADVDDLNARARVRVEGRLEGPVLEVAGRSFQAGDEVVTLHNHRRIGVRNGDRWTVIMVDHAERSLRLAPRSAAADAPAVTVPAFYLTDGHLDHAYATTIHKAQGITVDWLGVLGSDVLYREAGYVALSRGRQENRLYVVSGLGENLECDEHSPAPSSQAGQPAAFASIGRSRAQALALDHDATSAGATPQELSDDRARRISQHLRDDDRRTRHESRLQHGLESGTTRLERAGANDRSRGSNKANHLRYEHQDSRTAHANRDEARALIERLQDLETVIRRGERSHAQAIELDAPPYIIDAVGTRPGAPTARRTWRQAVAAIEHYRQSWDITDARRPLGDAPPPGVQALHFQTVERLIDDTRDLSPHIEPKRLRRPTTDVNFTVDHAAQ